SLQRDLVQVSAGEHADATRRQRRADPAHDLHPIDGERHSLADGTQPEFIRERAWPNRVHLRPGHEVNPAIEIALPQPDLTTIVELSYVVGAALVVPIAGLGGLVAEDDAVAATRRSAQLAELGCHDDV